MASARLRGLAVGAAAAALRRLCRRLPEPAQRGLHERLIAPCFAWREMPLDFRTGDGFRLRGDMRDLIVRQVYFNDTYEPGLVRVLRATLRPGDVFIDVGANFGLFSLLAAGLVGKEGQVWAFDASPSIFLRLQRTLEDNGVTNVVARQIAISDRRRRLPVFLAHGTNPGATTTVEDGAEILRRGARLEGMVDALPLCEAVPPEALARAAVIKIDVEGAEADVLAGLAPALDILRPDLRIVLELNIALLDRARRPLEEVLAPFLARGFRALAIPDRRGRMPLLGDLRSACDALGIANFVLAGPRAGPDARP